VAFFLFDTSASYYCFLATDDFRSGKELTMRTLSPLFLRNAKVSEFVKFKNFELFFFHAYVEKINGTGGNNEKKGLLFQKTL